MNDANNIELGQLLSAFLLEYPFAFAQQINWELYTAWVYEAAAVASPEAHANMLMYYERITELLERAAEITSSINIE